MKTYIIGLIALCLVSFAFCDIDHNTILDNFVNGPTKELFKVYHFLFKKLYDLNSEEGVNRYKIFKANMNYIKQKNAENLTFKLGINQFTDLTNEEFKATILIPKTVFEAQKKEFYKYITENGEYVNFDEFKEIDSQQPFSANWTTVLGPAKNQGQCGSCWTFAAAASLEANYNIKFNPSPLILFSEQQYVDCAKSAGNGCNGGLSNLVYRYTQTSGIMTSASYPYTSSNGRSGTCKYNATLATIKNTGYTYCTNSPYNAETVKACNKTSWQGLLSKGPFAVYMEADSPNFQNYRSGVWIPGVCDCNAGADHAVTAVGWGTDPVAGDYVLVRNSWGTWGDKGHFRIQYNPNNHDTCYITGSAFQPNF